MAPSTARSVVLLPIRPCYADPILAGLKRVEFRKRPFRREVSHVVVYSSSPVQRVVGFFEILGIEEDSPEQLWRRFSGVGYIDKEDYDRYFAQSSRGVAIRVGQVHTFQEPFALGELGRGLRVPQSYAYLNPKVLSKLRSRSPQAALARSA
jgi:predicted transcriptional regulator